MANPQAMQLAEVGIGALRVGVPVESVVEAIALPAAPERLPRRRGALAGVVEHDGRLVPVVDLARWVDAGVPAGDAGAAAPRAGRARVLVLRQDGRTFGLKVDAVGGLVDVGPGDLMRLHHDDDPEEVFHSAARAGEGGRVLSLLDAGRLARLAAAWNEDAAAAGADGTAPPLAPAHAAGATRQYALLRVGAQRLAVPAEALSEVVPMPPLEHLGGPLGAGWCRWRGRHLAVLAPAAVLPAAQYGAECRDAPLLAVIERAGLALGLPVQAALHLDTIDDTGLATPGGLVATACDRDGQPVQLLDDAALFERFPEAALSAGGDAGAGAAMQSRNADAAVNRAAYIVFEADGLQAVAIDAVERILGPHEATLQAMDDAACLSWDGRAIAVRDLRAPAQRQTPPHLLLIRCAGGLRACAVTRVHLLIPPGGGRMYRIGAGPRALAFITAGDGAAQASYRICDLGAD